jgi:insulysin
MATVTQDIIISKSDKRSYKYM